MLMRLVAMILRNTLSFDMKDTYELDGRLIMMVLFSFMRSCLCVKTTPNRPLP